MELTIDYRKIALYILAYAIALTAMVAALDFFDITSNSGSAISQAFMASGLCLYVCQSLGSLEGFVKSHPKSTQSFIFRYVFLIGFPAALVPVLAIVLLLALGLGDLLAGDLALLVLLPIAGITYFICAVIFGLTLPGALKAPAGTIGEGARKGLRNAGRLAAGMGLFMAPFAIFSTLIPLAAAYNGWNGSLIAANKSLDLAGIAISLSSNLVNGVGLAILSLILMTTDRQEG